MCDETLTEPKKIKTNGSVMEKIKVCLYCGMQSGMCGSFSPCKYGTKLNAALCRFLHLSNLLF